MYYHADQLPEDTILQGFDICIVGAGAAGIAMAQRLANSSLKVILLVSGSRATAACPPQRANRSIMAWSAIFWGWSIPSFPSARA